MKLSLPAYPLQYWLLFGGTVLATFGMSMVWPFQTIYLSEQTDLPLTAIGGLITLSSVAGLLMTFIAGPITDRTGRKRVIVISLIANGLAYFLLGQSSSVWMFIVLLTLRGAINTLFQVGADSMLADVTPQGQRAGAYALFRMGRNASIAIGPAIGGFVSAYSYQVSFGAAAIALCSFGLIMAIFGRETRPSDEATAIVQNKSLFAGYEIVFGDRRFLAICLAYMLSWVGPAVVWVMMALYVKDSFGIPESQFGFIGASNAALIVLFQVLVTRGVKRFPVLPLLLSGSVIYNLAVVLIAFGSSFWYFLLCMVILTIGEMLLVPTSDAYAADLAPANMRGRYLSIYSLSWAVSSGIGPLIGGALNDSVGAQAMWIGSAAIGLIGALIYLAMIVYARRTPQPSPA